MTTYYVATLAQCVVVDAESEDEARERGAEAIAALGRNVPIRILTIRPATPDEIDLHG